MAKIRKLVMITGDNNNKYYDMFDNENGTFTVKYGRIGVTEQTQDYSIDLWDKKYNEKVKKGYKDQTDMFLVPTSNGNGNGSPTFVDIKDSAIKSFIDALHRYAKKSVSDNYTVSASAVTEKQVEEAQAIIDYLTTISKRGSQVRPINDKLIELYHVIPRRMKHVQDHLFQDIATLAKIDEVDRVLNKLAEEQATLDVMRGQVQLHDAEEASDTKKGTVTLLDAMGLRLDKIGKTDETKIRGMMSGEASKFRKAFQVVNIKTQKKFDTAVGSAPDKTVKLFWHGSRNENWLSIMEGGLVLRPANAIITGKMFGYGLYFADKFRKSLGYTSLSGSYWASGNSNTAILALYDVHLGKYLKVKHHEGWMSSLNYDSLRRKGTYDSLFAEGGADLRNNEYIVYKENQCTIKYIVEVGN